MKGKKQYNKPHIKTIKIQEPLAYACNIYNASGGSGTWEGSGVTDPTFIC